MKTITWSEFITLIEKTDIIKIDGLTTTIYTSKDKVIISWEDNGSMWKFQFVEEQNETVSIKDNSATAFCDEYDVDAFTFEFFSLIPVKI